MERIYSKRSLARDIEDYVFFGVVRTLWRDHSTERTVRFRSNLMLFSDTEFQALESYGSDFDVLHFRARLIILKISSTFRSKSREIFTH